ncbi:MAG: hypothetical protein AAGA57_03415 [Planctomycetota bacterium]
MSLITRWFKPRDEATWGRELPKPPAGLGVGDAYGVRLAALRDAAEVVLRGEEAAAIPCPSPALKVGDVLADLEGLRRAWPGFDERLGATVAPDRDPGRALALVDAIAGVNPCASLVLQDLWHASVRAGRVDDSVGHHERCAGLHPEADTGLLQQHPLESLGEVGAQIGASRQRGLPGILFNTMPKSGSVFLGKTLSRGLGLAARPMAIPSHPLRDHAVRAWAGELAKGGSLCQEHLPATPTNLGVLEAAGIAKLVVHVRDPRQAMLSSLHHLQKNAGLARRIMAPYIPEGFEGLALEPAAAWMIEHYLPELIAWVRGWARAESAGRVEVCWTRYADLHADVERVVDPVLRFYGVDAGLMSWPEVATDEGSHYRKGERDEWRRALPSELGRRMTEALPDDLATRFGWER